MNIDAPAVDADIDHISPTAHLTPLGELLLLISRV